MAKAKKIVFTGGGTVGHVTLNLILIPKFLKDGWEGCPTFPKIGP